MGVVQTLGGIKNAVMLEYGCMGHALYAAAQQSRAGILDGCKLLSTHIDEADIAMGVSSRIEEALRGIAEEYQPEAVFLTPSAVPQMIGTDIDALCMELQPQFPAIPLIPVNFGGFKTGLNKAVAKTLEKIVQSLCIKQLSVLPNTYNIIGSCLDLFKFKADCREITRLMKNVFGMEPNCVLSSDTDVGTIKRIPSATINLCIRREGKPAADWLCETFGTPSIEGRPYGLEGTTQWLEQIAETTGISADKNFLASERAEIMRYIRDTVFFFGYKAQAAPDAVKLNIGGHPDVVAGLLEYGTNELKLRQGECWSDSPDLTDRFPYYDEDKRKDVISGGGILMASGELLCYAGKNHDLQIANPDLLWRTNPYIPPLIGYRGALFLMEVWLSELSDIE
jgi:nitrogenase molybdenum-iron protein alpha/beta subunit